VERSPYLQEGQSRDKGVEMVDANPLYVTEWMEQGWARGREFRELVGRDALLTTCQ